MRRSVLVAMSLLLAWLAAHAWSFLGSPPGSDRVAAAQLLPPFQKELGHAFVAKVSIEAPSAREGGRSRLWLSEDGTWLQPGNAMHAAIREQGKGAFSHWGDALYFSTSDGSDPNTNGRVYRIEVPQTVAIWPHLSLLAIDFLVVLVAGLFVTARWLGPRLRWWVRLGFVAACTMAMVEAASAVLLAHRLATEGDTAAELFGVAMGRDGKRSFHGESVQYAEHHYLDYVLNPDFRGGVAQQFERAHRIRRSEPLRERTAVRWRILALGGSTTYGEILDAEQDTWVHRLEARLRGEFGGEVDVINGGVGGYTVVENLIHYLVLLSELQPDVVLLYVGINDVHPRLFGTIATDYSNYRVPWRSEGSVLPVPWSAATWSSVYGLFYFQNHVVPLRRNGIGGVAARPYPPADSWAESLTRNGPQVYRDHLRNLVRLLLAQGRRVAILPQYYVATRPDEEVFARGVRENNEVDRAVAGELGAPFLGELLAEGAFERSDTFDTCHFNAKGSARMAEHIVAFLRREKLLPK